MSKNLHVYACTPAYDGRVYSDYSQSLAAMSYCAPLFGVQLTVGVRGNEAFIDLARNNYVKKFLEDEELKDCTHLFFLDADIGFEERAFLGLVKSGHDICAGVYRRRQEPEEYPFRWVVHPTDGGLWFDNDWLMCDRVPTGFLCISRKIIEEMAADAPKIHIHGSGLVPWVFHTEWEGDTNAIQEKYGLSDEFVRDYGKWLPSDGAKFVGEDFGFCNDYQRKYGKPIPVWTNFTFKHAGYAGNLFNWLTEQKQQSNGGQMSAVA